MCCGLPVLIGVFTRHSALSHCHRWSCADATLSDSSEVAIGILDGLQGHFLAARGMPAVIAVMGPGLASQQIIYMCLAAIHRHDGCRGKVFRPC